MRILVAAVGRDTSPTGICRVAANHAMELLDAGVASTVALAIGPWQRNAFELLLREYVSRVDLIDTQARRGSWSRNWWYLRELPRLARRYCADLVHLSYPAPLVRRSFHCPVVVTLHDLYPYDIPENFGFPQYIINRLVLRQCLSSADGIACVSGATRTRFEELFPAVAAAVPSLVTGNYVRMLTPANRQPDDPGAPGQPKDYLLTVGQHRKNKNLDLLISAYARVFRAGIFQGNLVIVGSDGPETARLHALSAASGLGERIVFLKSVSDARLQALYQDCSLFAVCSSIEGYCLPLVEALDCGVRTICSDIPVLHELGGEQCRYFRLGSDAVGSFADAIEAALKQPGGTAAPPSSLRTLNVVAEYRRLYAKVCSGAIQTGDPVNDRKVQLS